MAMNKTDTAPGFMKLIFCLFNKVDWWISKRHYSELQCVSGFFRVLSQSVISDSLKPHGLHAAHQTPLSMGFSRQES